MVILGMSAIASLLLAMATLGDVQAADRDVLPGVDNASTKRLVPSPVTMFGAKCDSSGASGSGTDDSVAFVTADATGLGFSVPGKCRIGGNLTLRSRVHFGPQGMLVIDAGKVVTLTSADSPVAGKKQHIFGGSGSTLLSVAPYVSVAWWGALTATDAAPAFRAAMASNRTIDGAGGSYTFGSTESLPAPYTHLDPPSVLLGDLSNFTLDLTNSTIKTGSSVIHSSQFMIDRSANFHIVGGTFVGATASNHEATAFILENVTDFSLQHQTFNGNWGGIASPFAGNWLTNGSFTDLQMDGVGQCFDFGQVHNLYFENVRAIGSGDGHVGAGQKCFSFYNDEIFKDLNFTHQSWKNINNCIIVKGNHVSNFNVGFVAAAGTDYLLHANEWANNPGSPGVGGYGVLLYYVPSGQYTSVNFPVSNVTIDGDRFIGNGRVTPGAGILLESGNIANVDIMQNIAIVNSTFDNNSATAIDASSAKHMANVSAVNNTFLGAKQTVEASPNFTAGAAISGDQMSDGAHQRAGCSAKCCRGR